MKVKILIGLLFVIIASIGIVFVLASEDALVIHPKGIIANQQLELIIVNVLLMLSIILPTYLLLFLIVWKCCIKKEIKYDPNHSFGASGQLILWLLPSLVIVVMAFVLINAAHRLDPYRPLESDIKPLSIQVVALNWKWLFIYPEQGIATLNFMQIPEKTPINLKLTADNAPMNSFWVPELAGQIYAMTGMITQLHLMTDQTGAYEGRQVEINGEGYSDMTFTVRATSPKEFEQWISEVKKAPLRLTEEEYQSLIQHAINKSVIYFSDVDEGLFHKIVHKYMYPTEPVL